MNRAEKAVIATTMAVVLLMVVLNAITPSEPDWHPSYTEYRNDPYACSAVRQRLGDLFPQGITTVREPIFNTGQARLSLPDSAQRVNHIFIERWFNPDAPDLHALLQMVQAGDNAFIAAEDFSGSFIDTLGFTCAYHYPLSDSLSLASVKKNLLGDTSLLYFAALPSQPLWEFRFARGGMDHYFNTYPKGSALMLAKTGRNNPVLMQIHHGKGSIYLCSVPLAFTNYYILKDDARGFMEHSFGLLPDWPVLWDEYLKAGRTGSTSPLRYILAQPALRRAYWVAIALLLLTVLVYGRRRQRAIPELPPPSNTSLEFAETIGRLYYFRGNHADLACKLSAQFKEEVRRTLRLQNTEWKERTIGEITLRTGIGEEELQHAARLMEYYATAVHVSEEQLLTLNKTLTRLRNRL